jgi:hypothetical protein
LVCLATLSGAAAADEADTFRNPTAGFELTKPAEWQYITAAEAQENLKATKLNDQEFQAAMLKYATVPMVAMMKYPEPYDDINPSFKVNIKPLGQLKGRTAVELVSMILPQLQKVFKDYELVQAPVEIEVSGLKAAYARINYSLETVDGSTFPCASELWIVPRGDYFFMLGAGTRQDETTGARSEIQGILKSVKIDH